MSIKINVTETTWLFPQPLNKHIYPINDVEKTFLKSCRKHADKTTWILHGSFHEFSVTF